MARDIPTLTNDPYRRWTKAEDATLMRCVADEIPMVEIGLMIGRSEDACRGRYRVKGYHMVDMGAKLTRDEKFAWAKATRDLMSAGDVSQKQIAAFIGVKPSFVCEILSLRHQKSFTADITDRIDVAVKVLSAQNNMNDRPAGSRSPSLSLRAEAVS